jgi:hypothetical protein
MKEDWSENSLKSYRKYSNGDWIIINHDALDFEKQYKQLLIFLKKNFPDAAMAWKMLNEGEDLK